MANIKAFSFYKSYYDALKEVSDQDKKELIFAIINFVFEDKTPKFNGIKKIIWTLIEPNLSKSKNRSNDSSGAPIGNQNARKYEGKGGEKNSTIKKQPKNNQISINHIKSKSYSYSLSYSLSSSLSYSNSNIINNEIINKLFIEYIQLREDNNYALNETIIKRLVNKIEQLENDEDKQEMIEQAIIHKWKDFYPVAKKEDKNSEGITVI